MLTLRRCEFGECACGRGFQVIGHPARGAEATQIGERLNQLSKCRSLPRGRPQAIACRGEHA
jgi:hypothetical protein